MVGVFGYKEADRNHNLETSFETMVIEAFGMDETATSIQEAFWKIKWTLDRIDLALERMNETKLRFSLTTSPFRRSMTFIAGLYLIRN